MSRQKSIGRGKKNKCKMMAILVINVLTTSHAHFILSQMQKIQQLSWTVVAATDGNRTQQPTEYDENDNLERMRPVGGGEHRPVLERVVAAVGALQGGGHGVGSEACQG